MLTNAELVFTSRFRRSETHESTCPRPAYVAQEILQEETAIYNHLISAMFGIVRCVKRAREQQANCLICTVRLEWQDKRISRRESCPLHEYVHWLPVVVRQHAGSTN
jgi:hypothetical protein